MYGPAVGKLDLDRTDEPGRIRRLAAIIGQDGQEVLARLEQRCNVQHRSGSEIVPLAGQLAIDPQLKGVVGRHHGPGRANGAAAFDLDRAAEISRSDRGGGGRIAFPTPNPLGLAERVGL